jgi:hypothetical protein
LDTKDEEMEDKPIKRKNKHAGKTQSQLSQETAPSISQAYLVTFLMVWALFSVMGSTNGTMKCG